MEILVEEVCVWERPVKALSVAKPTLPPQIRVGGIKIVIKIIVSLHWVQRIIITSTVSSKYIQGFGVLIVFCSKLTMARVSFFFEKAQKGWRNWADFSILRDVVDFLAPFWVFSCHLHFWYEADSRRWDWRGWQTWAPFFVRSVFFTQEVSLNNVF